MQFEAEEPVHTGLATTSASAKDLVRVNAPVVADTQTRGINKGDATTVPFPPLQIGAQGDQSRGHQFHKAVVACQAREGPTHVLENVLSIEALEITVARLMKEHDDGHDFRQAQRRSPLALPRLKQMLSPIWFKEQTEVVYVAENG